MTETFFMHRIKHNSSTDAWDKGIEVKDSLAAALQSYHAYLGAYAYGHDANTDMVSCMITNIYGTVIEPFHEAWIKTEEQENEGDEEV